MRQLTAYASYLDNLGAPLVGRARFYNLDGEPSVVYARDNATDQFIPNGTSVFTNSSGQLEPQVFLDDHDYLIVFDKYIGHGTMSEDDEQESWEEQGSAVDRYNTLGIVLEGDSLRAISTIAELRQTAGIDDGEVVTLLGYEAAGDKPAINYIWQANNADPDDGGSTIGSAPRGRWVMLDVPSPMDVRHFGAFPTASMVVNAPQRNKVQLANDYAHSRSLGLYFPASDTACYYDITSLTLYDVDCNPGARVFAYSSSTDTRIVGIRKIYCASGTYGNGRITLVDDEVRTSWEGDSDVVLLSPTRKLVVDSQIRKPDPLYEDIEVEILTYSRMTIDHCIVNSNGRITGPMTIRNCELHTSWFSEGYDFVEDLRTDSNTILLQNCDTAQNYVILKNKQEEADYGDLGEQQIHDIDLLPGCIAENASFLHVILEGDSELHNVSGSCKVHGSCNWVDCWMELENDSYTSPHDYEGLVPRFSLNRGTVTSKAGSALPLVDELVASQATIATQMMVHSSLRLDNCEVYNLVTHEVLYGNTMVEEYVTNCRFLQGSTDGGRISVVPRTQGSVVKAVWVDNYSDVQNPLTINRTALVADDSAHDYVYRGNTGTFIKDRQTVKYTGVVIKTATASDYWATAERQLLFYDSDFGNVFWRNSLQLGTGQSYSIPWDELEVFTVGTEYIKNVKATFMLAASGPDNERWASAWGLAEPLSVPVLLEAVHKEGFVANLYRGQQHKVFQFAVDFPDDVIGIKPTTANTGVIYVDYEVL